MSKIHEDKKHGFYWFNCPGCGYPHRIDKTWEYNGDKDNPTIKPSILVTKTGKIYADSEGRCHSFVTDGKIQFLNDCGHKLAGQTVEIPEFDEENWSEGGNN